MTGNEYQRLAARTIGKKMTETDVEYHALHGMVGEIGELHSIYQKDYQGHDVEESHLKKELGDLLWFIAEYCTSWGWKLDDIMQMNIDKLKARYPEGFSTEKSLHRKEGDI
jgi:NTP pyrophosphatase (non-canonical NTP hydrolase)